MKKQIKCDFTSVNLQLEHRTIGCKISRLNISLETADKLFGFNRLIGTVEVIRDDEAEGQQPLIKDTVSSVTAAFDVRNYSVNAEDIKCTLIFAKGDVDPATLDGFLKRSGQITVTNTEAIPEKEKDE